MAAATASGVLHANTKGDWMARGRLQGVPLQQDVRSRGMHGRNRRAVTRAMRATRGVQLQRTAVTRNGRSQGAAVATDVRSQELGVHQNGRTVHVGYILCLARLANLRVHMRAAEGTNACPARAHLQTRS
eukprot:364554-Chlamydomonas_euryale.AAC.4